MPFLQPDFTFFCYRDLTAGFLREQGFEVLLMDLDNTIAPYEQLDPDDHVRAWLAALAEGGIRVALFSNNHADRMERFNKDLHLPCRPGAWKPLPFRGRKLMRRMGGNKKNTLLVGDQIFTDVICARMMGVRAAMVPPIVDKTNRFTRLKRYFERGPLKRYHKRLPDAPDIREGSPLTKEHVKVKEEKQEQ